MADYALTGKKGTGKSKNAIRIARRYLLEGRTVASNLDIYLDKLFGDHSKLTYVRVPDKPTAFDLQAAGHGNPDSYNEDKNGALILDEMATWMNTRSFGDKDRTDTLDFFAHGRKLGWDAFYIMQNVAQVDKQLREAFIEYTVRHIRFDKVKIPFVGGLVCALFGDKAGYFPRFHVAVTRLGTNPQDIATDRTMFRGDDVHAGYDTRQVFRPDYPHGTHSVLSPWHLVGRHQGEPLAPWYVRIVRWWQQGAPKPRPPTPLVPAVARVQALCVQLPPDQGTRILSRYLRHHDAAIAARRAGHA